MSLYDKLLKEVTGQNWELDGEGLVSFQKFNEEQILLLNQNGKIVRVLDGIISLNVSKEEIEVHFYDADEYDDYFVITSPKID